jgi:hypothetical protein
MEKPKIRKSLNRNISNEKIQQIYPILQSVKKEIDSMENHPNPVSYSSAKGRVHSQLEHFTLSGSNNQL